MKRKKYISGLFSNTLQKCASWFLYIFIDPSAPVSKTILKKRERQIATLQLLDRINGVYNFQQLVNFVEAGIKKKYGLTPVQVLSVVHHVTMNKVSGIGSDGDVYTSPAFDGTNWINYETGEPLPAEEQANCTEIANSTVNGTFWEDLKGIVEWIVNIFQQLGVGKKTTDFSSGTGSFSDWRTDTTTKADMSSTVTYVAAALIGYALWKSTNQN